MSKWFTTAAAVAFGAIVAITAAPASATLLPAGTPSASPDTFGSISGTVQDTISGSFSTATFSGSYITEAILTSGGTYDFIIQVTSNSSSSEPIQVVSTGRFPTSTSLDVGYLTAGSTAGTLTTTAGDVLPTSLSRLSTAVDFNILNGLTAGSSSAVFVLVTDATSYGFGTIGLIDSTVAQVTGFTVPEPGSLLLLGTGLIAFGMVRRSRRRRSA